MWLRNRTLLVLLCDAVARGLIQPQCGPDGIERAPPAEKARSRQGRGGEKAAGVHGGFLDPAALQDVRKASEVCSVWGAANGLLRVAVHDKTKWFYK